MLNLNTINNLNKYIHDACLQDQIKACITGDNKIIIAHAGKTYEIKDYKEGINLINNLCDKSLCEHCAFSNECFDDSMVIDFCSKYRPNVGQEEYDKIVKEDL